MWQPNIPVSYQHFQNFYYHSNSPEYDCALCGSGMKIEKGIVYPHHDKSRRCTLMVMLNLAEPNWVQISCSQKINLTSTLCFENLTNLISANTSKQSQFNLMCTRNQILKDGTCHTFTWVNIVLGIAKPTCTFSEQMSHFEFFMFLFEAIDSIFPPVFVGQQVTEETIQRFTYKKYLDVYQCRKDYINVSQITQGFLVCTFSQQRTATGDNMLQCNDKTYESSFLSECSMEGRVPQSCGTERSNTPLNRSKDGQSSKERHCCSDLCHLDSKGSCSAYLPFVTTQPVLSKTEDVEQFICNNGLKLNSHLVNDLFGDCGDDGEDEPVLRSLVSFQSTVKCKDPSQIPCKQGHSKCMKVTDICTYKLGQYGNISPCRTGGHLADCELFDCNVKFKCRDAYCIPWSLVCDRKWDCPLGEDEKHSCSGDKICTFMYKCHATQHICLHLGNICDGTSDCPKSDDEQLCQLQNIFCPVNCTCFALAVTCQKFRVISLPQVYPYISVKISAILMLDLTKFERTFPSAVFVSVVGGHLLHACKEFFNVSTVLLDLSENKIPSIEKTCFNNLKHLKILSLSTNLISKIQSFSFANLTSLGQLELSFNPLVTVEYNLFSNSSLKIVSMKNLTLKDISLHLFARTKIVIVDTTDYHICCISPSETLCTQEIPWYITCQRILPGTTMKAFYIAVSVFVFMVNSLSAILHCTSRNAGKGTKAFAVNVVSININDLLMFVYLSVIWIADLSLKDKFVVEEEQWRSGGRCFFAFFTILLFTIVGQLSLLLLSTSRLMVVVHPMDTNFKRFSFIWKCLVFIYVPSLLFTLLITLLVAFKDKMLALSLCLPFLDPSESVILLKFITWLAAISQTLSSVVILILHTVLVQELKESQKHVVKSKSKKNSNAALFTQLVFLTISNIISWVPSNTVFLLTMFLRRYPIELALWITVVGLPNNSLINPTVFFAVCLRNVCKSDKRV